MAGGFNTWLKAARANAINKDRLDKLKRDPSASQAEIGRLYSVVRKETARLEKVFDVIFGGALAGVRWKTVMAQGYSKSRTPDMGTVDLWRKSQGMPSDFVGATDDDLEPMAHSPPRVPNPGQENKVDEELRAHLEQQIAAGDNSVSLVRKAPKMDKPATGAFVATAKRQAKKAKQQARRAAQAAKKAAAQDLLCNTTRYPSLPSAPPKLVRAKAVFRQPRPQPVPSAWTVDHGPGFLGQRAVRADTKANSPVLVELQKAQEALAAVTDIYELNRKAKNAERMARYRCLQRSCQKRVRDAEVAVRQLATTLTASVKTTAPVTTVPSGPPGGMAF